jgi:hypothetical protein
MSRKSMFYLGLILLGVILVLTAAMLIFPSAMSPTDATTGEINTSKNGEEVEFVGQITEIKGTVLVVEILQGNASNIFDQRTGQFVEVVQTSAPEIVMGSSADIFVGALGQFRGTKTGDNQIQLNRIVILTGYVTGPTP